MEYIILICFHCNEMFSCDHEMKDVWGFDKGVKINVPHCSKCDFDDGKCPAKHGLICMKCKTILDDLQKSGSKLIQNLKKEIGL